MIVKGLINISVRYGGARPLTILKIDRQIEFLS